MDCKQKKPCRSRTCAYNVIKPNGMNNTHFDDLLHKSKNCLKEVRKYENIKMLGH